MFKRYSRSPFEQSIGEQESAAVSESELSLLSRETRDNSSGEASVFEKNPQEKPSNPYYREANEALLPSPRDEECVLGEGLCFSGNLSFSSSLRIDGQFKGELTGTQGKVHVGPKGVVESDIEMDLVIIEGSVRGNIRASERVELRGEADVEGNISSPLLSIDEGVRLKGSVEVSPLPRSTQDEL